MANDAERAVSYRVRNKLVGIDALPVNGNKKEIFFNLPAVNHNAGNFF